MIKQWIVHFEWHRNYRWLPRFSITPKIKHNQIGSDGGQVGKFIYCETCSGAGTLFVPDEPPKKPLPPGPHTWDGFVCVDCEADASWCPYPPTNMSRRAIKRLIENVRASDHMPTPAMDFNVPASRVVEFPIIEELTHEQVEQAFGDPVTSPETLELDYTLGTRTYKTGEVVWTRRAEYVVDGVYDKTLYLVRKDVWEKRNKVSETLTEHEMKVRRGDVE